MQILLELTKFIFITFVEMKGRYLYMAFLMGFIGSSFSSCTKKPDYPSEPVITYEDFLRYGNPASPDSVKLVISFTDNEGDIGFEDGEAPDSLKDGNFFMIYFFWDSTTNSWLAIHPPPLPPVIIKYLYQVPPILPEEDDSEPVKGYIYATIREFFVIDKRIKFKVYMYDKALHKSNIIETPPLDF